MLEGKVVRIGKPKLYHGAWGTSRKFFVLFADETKAMFAAAHLNKFAPGDTIQINGNRLGKDGWQSVPESAEITLMVPDAGKEIVVKFDVRYVTKLREIADKKYFESFSFTVVGPIDEETNKIKKIHLPIDAAWTGDGHVITPAYCEFTAQGTVDGDTFFVKEVLQQLAKWKEENVIIDVKELHFHKMGADFDFSFGNETYRGAVKVPFFSSPAFNSIRGDFPGHVEIRGVWMLRGYMFKDTDGSWKEKTFWKLWRGKEYWEDCISKIQEIIKSYEATEAFRNVVWSVTDSGKLLTEAGVAEEFTKAGFPMLKEEVQEMLWRREFDRQSIKFLKDSSKGMYFTPEGEFFFEFDSILISDIPENGHKTIVFKLDMEFADKISQIRSCSRTEITQSKDLQDKLQVLKIIPHKENWEDDVGTAIVSLQVTP